MPTETPIDLERSKANFAWWYENRFSKNPDDRIQKEMKCTCGQKFVRVQPKMVTGLIPLRYITRYVDFENKTADTCFSCGSKLEFVVNLIQEKKDLKKERNQLIKRLKEIDLELNTKK